MINFTVSYEDSEVNRTSSHRYAVDEIEIILDDEEAKQIASQLPREELIRLLYDNKDSVHITTSKNVGIANQDIKEIERLEGYYMTSIERKITDKLNEVIDYINGDE